MTSNHVLWFIVAIFVLIASTVTILWVKNSPNPRPISKQCLLCLGIIGCLISISSFILIGTEMYRSVYHVDSDSMSEPDTLQITGR
jgi:RsiW-degrading membrane proteinase PrsW (M82 family)